MNNARLSKTRDFECGLIFQSLRNKAHLRQQDIATMVGVGVNTVQYWESGTTYPKVETLKKLLELYLRFEVFSSGQEQTEAEELWEKVRQEAPRLNALFDRTWFAERLASVSRDRQFKSDRPDNLPRVPNNLPARLTSFVGRKKERIMLSGWLRPLSTSPSVKLVTLSGEGGCGKTSLALEIARETLASYPQGVWLVDLAPLSTASGVVQALASTLGLKEQANSPLLVTITDYLREKRILLVLDNCEHLINECARVVDSLLRECPQLVVLATSREVLKVAGETVFRVPSLTLPPSINSSDSKGASGRLAQELMEYEAVQLFVERGRSASPHFALTEQNKAVVARLCRRLDGIPLAIELAAARLRVLTIFELNERLADRFRLLRSSGDRTVLPRQQTLQATVDWSYALLSQPERLLFRRLSVFAGGWTLEAAEEICTLDGLEREDILDLLHELVNKSLVIAEEVREIQPVEDGQSDFFQPHLRFRLLETLREYGQEQLEQAGFKAEEVAFAYSNEKYQLQTRHLLYYTAFATKCTLVNNEGQTYDKGKGIKLLAAEYPNLREALNWSTSEQNQNVPDQLILSAMELAVSASHLWLRRSYFREAYEHLINLQNKAQIAGLDSTSQYGWISYLVAHIGSRELDHKQKQLLLEKSLDLFQRMENKRGIVRVLHRLGIVLKFRGLNKEAIEVHHQSLALATELGNKLYIIRSLSSLGDTSSSSGETAKATAYLQAGLKVAYEYGDPDEIANCLIHLGLLAIWQGENEAANRYLQECLPLLRETGNKSMLASNLGNLGTLAFNQQNYIQAHYYFEQCVLIANEIGNRRVRATGLNNLAEVALKQGDYQKALHYNQEALILFQETGEKLGIGVCLSNLANLERLNGKYKTAIGKMQECLTLLWEVGDKHYLLTDLLHFSDLLLDYSKAIKEDGKVYRHREQAVQLAGVVATLLTNTGEKLIVDDQEKLDHICQMGRQQLGESAFEQIFARGQAMTLEEAVGYALTVTEEFVES